MDLPRPVICISEKKKEKQKITQTFKKRKYHFILLLTCGQNYTRERILQNDFQDACFNCSRRVKGNLYFYPVDYHEKMERFISNPLPHCRPECAKRTMMGKDNNTDCLNFFKLMYGNVIPAPPRELLYIPGGDSLEEYHKKIDDKIVQETFENYIIPFFANMYVSSTMVGEDFKILKDIHNSMYEYSQINQASLSQRRPAADRNTVSLSFKDPSNNHLKSIFSLDNSDVQFKNQ